ncbi:EAL domain-containing response regulator [Leptospira ilyithenensis]|uniref:EAL domain-containing protein n=1 Tax=Leptospira ilyithenensis TaxID=2484901 RepID=A0A4R9LLP4_9LEPT|nr:EAL domain-containing response regulator [Leptospira ilyithenensis]TGN06898.1 EAL domain-containing protein [Leptospira ilyithenensis]
MNFNKALILDDEPDMNEFLSDVLKELDFREIIQLIKSTSFFENYSSDLDLIVLDLFMPDMDGVEILRYLGEAKSEALIILISGHSQSVLKSAERVAKAYGLNVIGSLTKPFSINTIMKTIEQGKDLKKKPKQLEQKEFHFSKEEILIGIKNKEIVLYYQPQINLHTKEISGFEALVRWSHPGHGIIFPDQFLPLVSKFSILGDLTKYLIQEACSFFGNLAKLGIKKRVSINISVYDLVDTSMPEDIISLIQKYSLDSNQVILELIETGKIEDHPKVLEILTRVCMKGIGLSIDDFGTGFSSLDQLSKAPFTELKIDKSFVFDVLKNANTSKIINSTVHLANQLKMEVVAEGIENKETRNLLRELGVHLGQGYYFSVPLPSSGVVNFIKNFHYAD